MDQDGDHGFLAAPLCDGYQNEMSDAQVVDYLERNPDFFVCRPSLLQNMTPPARWNNGAVVDLQRHWVDVLTGELQGLRECASSVIETSRVNLATQVRMHAAVLALLDADTLAEVLDLVGEELPHLFDVDTACIGIEAPGVVPEGVIALPVGAVAELIGDRDVVLLESIADDGTLFGPACETIRSAAVVRLQLGAVPGLLSFGSSVADTFSPRQGKELLLFLGQVVGWCITRLTSAKG
ncbi:MAG: DUF484 family protein [Rhodospirillales bacterium]